MSRIQLKTFGMLLAVAMLTSACAAGFDAATNQQKASGNGRSANVGDIQVRNALIVKDVKNPGQATFVGTIVNTAQDSDKITSFQIDQESGKAGEVTQILKPGMPVAFGLADQLRLPISLDGNRGAGSFVKVQINFTNNEPIQMDLLIENNDGIYADVEFGHQGNGLTSGEHIPFR